MKSNSIVNTEIKDLDFIYSLFDEAFAKKKRNTLLGLTTKKFYKRTLKIKLQYNFVIDNNISCFLAFAIQTK